MNVELICFQFNEWMNKWLTRMNVELICFQFNEWMNKWMTRINVELLWFEFNEWKMNYRIEVELLWFEFVPLCNLSPRTVLYLLPVMESWSFTTFSS